MKRLSLLLIAAVTLLSCTKAPVAMTASTKQPLFYKENVSDAHMTHDLNRCAFEAFKSDNPDESATKTKCMVSKGYTLFYN